MAGDSISAGRLRELLERIPRDDWQQPVAASELRSLQDWFRSQGGIELPTEYVELLLLTNGIQIDNDRCYSAEDCRWANQILYEQERYRRYVLLGREGNVAVWAYCRETQHVVISAFTNPDEVFEAYHSLADLIVARFDGSGSEES